MPCKYNKPSIFDENRVAAHTAAKILHTRLRAAKKQLQADGTDNSFWSLEIQEINEQLGIIQPYLKPILVEKDSSN